MNKHFYKITINNKGKISSHEVNEDSFVIGRGQEAHITCDHDLLSRKHLKIYFEKNNIMIEELGSTNGTWLNDKKIEKGKAYNYQVTDNLVLGGQNGLILYVTHELIELPNPEINFSQNVSASKPSLSNPDKTQNFNLNQILEEKTPQKVKNIAQKSKGKILAKVNLKEEIIENDFEEIPELKVANGISTISSSHSRSIKNNNNETSVTIPTLKKKPSHLKAVKESESTTSLDNKVKQFISSESLKLKENSLKKAEQIKKHALAEENQIIKNAHLREKEIIEKAKSKEEIIIEEALIKEKRIIESAKQIEKDILDTARAIEKEILDNVQAKEKEILEKANIEVESKKRDLEEFLKRSHEKISFEEKELAELKSKHDRLVNDFDEKHSALKETENKYNQKLKLLAEEVDSLKERVKNETQNLEELKGYHQTLKRSSELKIEELAAEERKMRAKIETEFYEAQGKTAKMFAEAEKAVALKETLQPEIQELKKEKTSIEKEISKLETACKKTQSESDKLEQFHNNLKEEIEKSNQVLVSVKKEVESKLESLKFESETIENEKKLLLNEKLNAQKDAENIILEAKEQSKKIIDDANQKNLLEFNKIKKALNDLEAKSKQFELESISHRDELISNAKIEIEKEKEQNKDQIEKLNHQKANIQDEIKWIEENAKKKANDLIAEANSKAESIINEAKKESNTLQNQAKETIITATNQTKQDLQKKKEQFVIDLSKMKESMMNDVNNQHQKNVREVQTMKDQLQSEREKLRLENEHISKLKIELEASIRRSDNLMNENYIQAEAKIQDMISKAQKRAKDIDADASRNKEKYLAEMYELKRTEENKIEEMKKNVENYAEKKHHEMAESYALIAQDYLTLELVKSMNSTVNEKLIKKLGDVFKKIVYEAVQGEIERKNVNLKSLFPRRKFNMKAISKNIAVAIFLGGFCYSVIYYPQLYAPVLHEIKILIKNSGIELPF